MHPTDRIPGFAICGRCAGRRQLGPCGRCGLLVCAECRGAFECAVCYAERKLAARRAERRERLREAGRRAAVVGLVAASGVAGLGAAFLPEAALCGSAAVAHEPALQLRLVDVSTAAEAGAVVGTASTALTVPPAWGEPLVFHCFTTDRHLTCCVVAPR